MKKILLQEILLGALQVTELPAGRDICALAGCLGLRSLYPGAILRTLIAQTLRLF